VTPDITLAAYLGLAGLPGATLAEVDAAAALQHRTDQVAARGPQ